LKGNSHKMFKL